MKRSFRKIMALAVAVFALAAVPAALADNGSTPPATRGQDPAAQQQAPTQQAPDQAGGQARGQRLDLLRLRLQLIELRFAKHCGSSSNGASERCLEFAKKAEERLTKLDGNLQARIARIQSICAATSTDERCKYAADRVALLQKLDEHVKALAQKVQDWLDGKTVSTTDPSSESSLDQAAAGLGKVSQQVGAGG